MLSLYAGDYTDWNSVCFHLYILYIGGNRSHAERIMWKKLLIGLCLCLPVLVRADTILVLGDSISAAYGIPYDSGWVSLLEARLTREYPGVYDVVNASVSGDTTAGGLQRLPALLDKHEPALVILELGGNDGLRGMPLTQMENNLQQIIDLSRERGAAVVLMSVDLPQSYGVFFNRRFRQVFDELEDRNDLPRISLGLDLLNGRDLIQNDGIHPTREAQPLLLEAVWSAIEKKLKG